VELRADTCSRCHAALSGDDPEPLLHQVIEIPPVRPVVTHYRRQREQVSRLVSVFRIGPSRRRENTAALIPGELGVVTADRFGAYDHLKGNARQVCWAHLRRDFQAMIDREDAGSVVGEALLACSDRLFANWKRVRDGTLSREDFAHEHLPSLRSEVSELLWRGWGCGCSKTRRVCGEIQRVEESLWTFASFEGVEPTNNAAERALRQGVC
jgi:transposase